MTHTFPITFSPPMLLAVRDGVKTMTRRLATSPLRHAKAGDLLWVRESYKGGVGRDAHLPFVYRADAGADAPGPWRPGFSMPRARSRFTLALQATRLEELHDITAPEAMREGVRHVRPGVWSVPAAPLPKGAPADHFESTHPVETFAKLWDALHGYGAWGENPRVLVLSFTLRADAEPARAAQ